MKSIGLGSIDRENLLTWYHANRRDLPWRKNRDPYRIWISETMLQQTTTAAVLPFYEKFLQRFTSLSKLAAAPIEDVYALWAGLGYYSRARNLHQAAKILVEQGGFAKTHTELSELPGFGPYTSRAVSSLAFSEPVGVLDGNVIRVLSRRENLNIQWWRTRERAKLQKKVDAFAAMGPSHEINQALMELGAQICIPQNPHCMMCPWMKSCAARLAKTIDKRPLKKPKRESEIWLWSPQVNIKNDRVLLVKNEYAPFLRSNWFLPGHVEQKKTRPKHFDFHHTITHHKIYVQIKKTKINKSSAEQLWVKISELSRHVPASLVKKAVAQGALLTCLIFMLGACHSGPAIKAGDAIKPPPGYAVPVAEALTNEGENYGAHFSADSKRIVFISRNRPKHLQPQAYEMDVATHRERRLTYQDGEVSDVIYDPHSDRLIYSSTTDEIKENPELMLHTLSKTHVPAPATIEFKTHSGEKLPFCEIYSSSLDGHDIRRLSDEVGFDGEATLRPQHSEIVFVSVRHKHKQLYAMNLGSNSATLLTPGEFDDESPAFSADGKKLLWSRASQDATRSEIWTSHANGSQPTVLITGPGQNVQPAWHPSGEELLFAANRDESSNYEIYTAKKDGSCIRRLTFHSAQDTAPEISPDGKKLLFTSTRTGTRQIYVMDYSPPPCADVPTPLQSEHAPFH